MSNGWNHAKGLADKHSSGTFVKLTNNGDKVVGAFLGEPYAREVHWKGDGYDDCSGQDCPHCAKGKRPSLRVSMNFFVPKDKDLKIIEGGTSWFNDLLKVREKYGLENWLFEVERHGESGSTKTTYTILPEKEISEEQKQYLQGLTLHDLEQMMKEGPKKDDEPQEDAPLPAAKVSDMVARLKNLPREAVDSFLNHMQVERVRDLSTRDERKANVFIASLEGKHRNSDEDQSEVDPFA